MKRGADTPVPSGKAALCVAIASLAIAIVPGPPGLLAALMGAAIVLAVIADWILAPRPATLAMERLHPTVMTIGEESAIVWRVSNPSRRKCRLRISDDIPPSLGAATRRIALVLPPGERIEQALALSPGRRGHFVLPGATVRTSGPLGLLARQGRRECSSELAVFPPLGSAKQAEAWLRKNRVAEIGGRFALFRGSGTEFESLREYGVDDEFRSIDWAASARNHKPVVRAYRAEVDQRLICMLDAGRTMAGTVAGVPRFEHALDALLMLGSVATGLGDRTGVVVFDDSPRSLLAPARLSGRFESVGRAVYRSEAQLVESDYQRAFAFVLSRFERRSVVVLFSELVASAVAESLVPAIGLLASHHRVVVASVQDPQVVSWAGERPRDVESHYRREAASWELQRRSRTRALLAGRGVAVVDEPPESLARRLCDFYVRAKAVAPL